MLSLAVQVSVNPTGYLGNKKTQHKQHRESYFRDYYQKNRERLLTPQRREQQKLWIAQKRAGKKTSTLSLWSDFFACKKPYCLTCIQTGIKENEYKLCGENCLVKHWITIYEKKNATQYDTNGVNDKIDSHTCLISLLPAQGRHSLHACIKNFFVFGVNGKNGKPVQECQTCQRLAVANPSKNVKPVSESQLDETGLTKTCLKELGDFKFANKQERQKRKDQAWRRLATKGKIAQVSGYNLPTYKEKRSIEELLKKHGEFSYLTGKPLGRYYLSTLDLDLRKTEHPEKVIARLEKNLRMLLGSLRVSYDKTKKGLHIDILTPECLPNEIIYYHGWGRVWNVGSIQSKGKYVVGEDKDKEFVKNGKWYWKVERNEEVKEKLARFFFMAGKCQEVAKEVANSLPQSFKKVNQAIQQQIKHTIQAKILSVKETRLTDFWKVFYLNQKSQKKGYFLLNSYQKTNILPNLNVGSTKIVLLVNGRKHDFLSRISRVNLFLGA